MISDFYVVFVVKPNDAVCSGTTMMEIQKPPGPLVKGQIDIQSTNKLVVEFLMILEAPILQMDRTKNSTILIRPYISSELIKKDLFQSIKINQKFTNV